MTRFDDLDRALSSWLTDEAQAPAPHGLLETVSTATARRRPRHRWLARASSTGPLTAARSARADVMPGAPRLLLLLIAIALVVALAAVGISGGGRPSIVIVASPAASIEASATPSTGPTASREPALGTVVTPLRAGRVLFHIDLDASVPAGAGAVTPKTWAVVYLDATGLHRIPTDADPTMSQVRWLDPTEIVFHSDRAGNRHLFVMRLDDGSVTQLTEGETTAEERPNVNADGSLIISDHFDWATNQDLGLRIWPRDGSEPTAITPVGDPTGVSGATQAVISPDGRSIAYVQVVDWNDVSKGAGLFIRDIAGGAARRLTPDAMGVGQPRFSPDGKTILVSSGFEGRGTGTGLALVPVAGGAPTRIHPDGFDADWSPDGSQIVFKVYRAGTGHNNELHVIDADGSHESTLWIGDGSTAETPDWGP